MHTHRRFLRECVVVISKNYPFSYLPFRYREDGRGGVGIPLHTLCNRSTNIDVIFVSIIYIYFSMEKKYDIYISTGVKKRGLRGENLFSMMRL